MQSLASFLTQTDFRFSTHTISRSDERPDTACRAGMSSRVVAALMLLAALLFLLAFPPACAQGITGSMTGTVTDSSGAVIVGAMVTVREVDTNLTRTTKTSAAGTFTITQLPPGHYSVKFDNPGFKA
jgi:uncharacterized surface anchored protein